PTGRSGSCWPSRPATGRFRSRRIWQASTRATEPRPTPRRSGLRWPGARSWIRSSATWPPTSRAGWAERRGRVGAASPLLPAERPGLLPHPNYPGGDAGHDGVLRHVRGHHRARAHDRVMAHGDSAEHAGPVTDPHVVTHVDVAFVDPLLADRPLHLHHSVVKVD